MQVLLSAAFTALLFPPVLTAAEVITVGTSSSTARTVLSSTVVPYKEVTLTAQMPGRIVKINGEVGSQFNKGDLLVKVDDEALQAKRNALWAQITAAQAALRNSQAQYQREVVSPRSRDLSGMPGMGLPTMMDVFMTRPFAESFMGGYDQDYSRYSDLMNSATGVSQAQSQLMGAWAQMNELNANLNDTTSIAPFEGIIMAKMVEEGDTVQPGQPLVKYGFVKFLRLKADVPAMLVSGLKEGMEVEVKVANHAGTMAKISQIYPIADPSRHTVVVKFDLPIGAKASPGNYAEIFLPNMNPGAATVITIPKTSLIQGRSLPTVLVADVENKSSSLRLVRLGADSGNQVVVVSGLKPGEKVINNPPAGAASGWYPGT